MKKIDNLVEKILEGIEFLLNNKKSRNLRDFEQLKSLKEKLKTYQKKKSYIALNHALQVYRTSNIFRAETETMADTDIWSKIIKISGELITLESLLDELDKEYYKWKEGEMRVFR